MDWPSSKLVLLEENPALPNPRGRDRLFEDQRELLARIESGPRPRMDGFSEGALLRTLGERFSIPITERPPEGCGSSGVCSAPNSGSRSSLIDAYVSFKTCSICCSHAFNEPSKGLFTSGPQSSSSVGASPSADPARMGNLTKELRKLDLSCSAGESPSSRCRPLPGRTLPLLLNMSGTDSPKACIIVVIVFLINWLRVIFCSMSAMCKSVFRSIME